MSRLLFTKQKLLPMCAILFEQLQKQRAASSGLLPLEINQLCPGEWRSLGALLLWE